MKAKYKEKSRLILISNELSREEQVAAIGDLFDELLPKDEAALENSDELIVWGVCNIYGASKIFGTNPEKDEAAWSIEHLRLPDNMFPGNKPRKYRLVPAAYVSAQQRR